MFEKVNPHHPDKVADRIAGAIVDTAYTNAAGGWLKSNPRIAVEVLLGHHMVTVIIETNLSRSELSTKDVNDVLSRLCPDVPLTSRHILIVQQDANLSRNQRDGIRVGDNGIFKGKQMTAEQIELTAIAKTLNANFQTDGKFIIRYQYEKHEKAVIICQSNIDEGQESDIRELLQREYGITEVTINPLGAWTGGTTVDCGATNRKLGSDMGDAVTGGGLHGKDLSKADVSVNIVCHMKAQRSQMAVEACTAIGDSEVTFRYDDGAVETMPYADVVEQSRLYIMTQHGSFEHFAEWGLLA